MLLVLVTVLIEMSAARGIVAFLANAGVIGLSTYSTNILTLLVIAAGTDYAIFLLGRYHEARNDGHGPRGRVLRHVPRDRARHPGFGPDHRRRGALPELHPAAVLPEPRRPGRDRRPRRAGRRADPGARACSSSAAASVCSNPSARRARGAGGGSARPSCAGPDRFWSPRWRVALIGLLALPGYKTSYDVGTYMPASAPSNVGYAAAERHFSQGAAESRTADDRGRPRSAQSHRHDPAGARRQGRLPHRRHRPGAVDHPAAGHAAGPHVDPVPDQRAERGADQQPALPAGPRRRPAQAGRRHQRLDRHPAAAVCAAAAVQRRHRRADRGVPADGRHGPGPARQDRQLRRLLPAAAQLLLLGATLFRHPDLLRRCGRCSTRSTASTR